MVKGKFAQPSKAQNIVNMIVDLHIFYRYAQHNHLGYLMMEEESLEAEPH